MGSSSAKRGFKILFKDQSRFYTWFYRVLVNTCKDFLRKKKVRQHLSFWFHRNGASPDADPVMNAVSPAKNAEEESENQELSAAIYEALDKLPFQQKSAFSLRYLEGLSLEEISESMEISVGTVKATLWQAGQKMQKYLGEFSPIGGRP
ncbi:MAG TPA: RNA polymerase sigma factor [bacterium]|nr:RNA polymerase sigma factor [bacterium]